MKDNDLGLDQDLDQCGGDLYVWKERRPEHPSVPMVHIPVSKWNRLVGLYGVLWTSDGTVRTGIADEIDKLIASVNGGE